MEQTGGSDNRLSVFGIVALAVAAAAILAFLSVRYWDDHQDPGIVIVDPRLESTIVVSVEGAVATPGAYDLPGVARVRDALEAAGGPRPDADLRDVNLARRLRDEERVVVPSANAAAVSVVARSPASPGPDSRMVDVNRATAAELEALPEIGPTLAGRIVEYREQHGPFQTIDELVKIDGISARMVNELRPLVTVGP